MTQTVGSDRFLSRAATYVRENPIEGLRTKLRGAPLSTWALVPLYAVATLIIGFWSKELIPARPGLIRVLIAPIVLIVFPTLIEEFIYRGLLLPRSLANSSPVRRFVAVTASTAVYVAAHPLIPLLGIGDSDFFLKPWNLVIVAMLGYAAGYSYIRSWSLRAPILIHWATVVVWNLFLKVQP